MKIRHLKQEDINTENWDNCIASSINGIIYAYSWYLDIVSPGWEALVYGDYESVMPLTQNKKFGFDYLYQPFFTQQLGIFSSNKIDKSLIMDFIHAIPEKFKLVEINLNKYNCIDSFNGFQTKTNITYELDLINNYENIFRKYSKNHIHNIRKAIRNKITISKGLMYKEISDFINRPDIFPGVKEKHYIVINQLIPEAIRNNRGYVYGAYDEHNTLCAVGFFVSSNSKACFILSVSSKEGRKRSAMYLLIDEFIKDFSNQNIILDFEGSNIAGVAYFYRGFGASPFNYPTIKTNNLPFPIKLLKN